MKSFVVFLILSVLGLCGAEPQTQSKWGVMTSDASAFLGHQVIDIHAHHTDQLDILKDFFEQHTDVDLWSDYLKLGRMRVRVPPAKQDQVQEVLKKAHLDALATVSIEDLAAMIEKENAFQRSPFSVADIGENDFFSKYRQYSDFQAFMKQMAADNPALVSLINIGTTFEKRNITGIKIMENPNNTTKPTIFYNGCQHAREWISPVTVMYIGYQLATSSDPTVKKMLTNFNWVIVPVVNADGYVYTQSQRMWRKNRQPNSGSSCIGTDINRNWGYEWNTGGSSGNPCSDVYHGASPFSSPEETAVANYIKADPTVVGYIDFHSFSQLWMDPWGWSYNLPKDHATQQALAENGVKAVYGVNGVTYEAGSVANIIYEASGGSLDWTYGAANVKFSYAIELRDQGQYGFLLPASEIIPQGKEMFAGVIAMAEYIQKNL